MRVRCFLGVMGVGLAAAACGSNVQNDAASAGGDGGSTTASTSATGGGDPCAGTQIILTAMSGNPPVFTLDASCPGSVDANETPHAFGYYGSTGGTPGSKTGTFIEGCVANGPQRFGLSVPLFAAGSHASDAATFSLSGVAWTTTDGLTVKIDTYGDVGQRIVGSFHGTWTSVSGSEDQANGTFDVCRTSDFLPP